MIKVSRTKMYEALEGPSDLLRSWDPNLSQDDDIVFSGCRHTENRMSSSWDNLSQYVDILKMSSSWDEIRIILGWRQATFRMSTSWDKLSQEDNILHLRCRHLEINYLGKTTSYFQDVDIPRYIMPGCRHLTWMMSSSWDKLSQDVNTVGWHFQSSVKIYRINLIIMLL